MGDVLAICSMCNGARATVLAPFPVCADCADGLAETQAYLEEMEANNPELKKIAEDLEDVLAHICGKTVTTYGIHARSVARMRANRENWRRP